LKVTRAQFGGYGDSVGGICKHYLLQRASYKQQ
jgi:hypothetical protein